MFWTTLLYSASCYTWYLILLPEQGQVYPVSLMGLGGLFLVALIPTSMGYAFNSRLLDTKPTVFKALLANTAAVLVMAGLTGWYAGFFPQFLLTRLNLLFPPFWQLVSWSLGSYYLYLFRTSPDPPSPEFPWGSLLAAVPAVFLLTFMERPQGALMAVILCWFLLLALSLALEGAGSFPGGVIRYDILTFHALVPVFLAFFLLAAAFLRDLRELLLGAKNFILYLLALLFSFLDKLFSAPSDWDPPDIFIPFIPEEQVHEGASEFPSWIVVLMFAPIILFLTAKLVTGLLNWLKHQLEAAPARPRGPAFSPLKALKLLVLVILFLAKKMVSLAEKLSLSLKNTSLRLFRKLKKAWAGWLPPRTPYRKVLRSYTRFLQWGRSRGCRRHPGETPLEYARRLEEHAAMKDFPRNEICRLTRLFLEARYSPYPVSLPAAEECEGLLRRIKHQFYKGKYQPGPKDLDISG